MGERDDRLGNPEDDAPQSAPRRGAPGRTTRSPMIDSLSAGERETQEREFTEDREMNEEERLEIFRDSLAQSVLPDLPPRDGYHPFWATTSNPRDTIQYRLRIGYRLVRLEDSPGWEGIGVTAGGVDGVIAVNEMVAMQLPERLYQAYMREVHHTKPLQEEEKLVSDTDEFRERAARRGAPVVEIGDGTANLVQRARPQFAG